MIGVIHICVAKIVYCGIGANDDVGSVPTDLSHHPLPQFKCRLQLAIRFTEEYDCLHPQQIGSSSLLFLAYFDQQVRRHRWIIAAFVAVGKDKIDGLGPAPRPKRYRAATKKLRIIRMGRNDHYPLRAGLRQGRNTSWSR